MTRHFLIILLFFITVNVKSQVIYKEVSSVYFSDKKRLKIQLPREYNEDRENGYNLLLVLQAEYLFEPVSGIVDYLSFWQEMPPSVVVGIMGNSTTYDYNYSKKGLPILDGKKLSDFIKNELIPSLEKKYNIGKFRIIIGHGISATYINTFILDKKEHFSGYIALDPLSKKEFNVKKIAEKIDNKFYFLAGISDFLETGIYEGVDKELEYILNMYPEKEEFIKSVRYEDSNHYNFVTKGISDALSFIYELYAPVRSLAFENEILYTEEETVLDYVLHRKKRCKMIFNEQMILGESNIQAFYQSIISREEYDSLKDFAIMLRTEQEEKAFSYCFEAEYYEYKKDFKKALSLYRLSLLKKNSEHFKYTEDYIKTKIYELENR